MGKLLFWVVLIIGILLAARILSRQAQKNAAPQKQRRSSIGADRAQSVPGEQMVRCAHCGIHLPRSDAVLMQGDTWCSAAHAKLGLRQTP